ncbi:MAG: hypothetical protein IKU15_07410 [Clostridia bacterium]|nr:hypothetical protein [Clostridia bacterium]
MAEEQIKDTPVVDEQQLTKEEKKANAVKKIVEFITKVMKTAVSRGDAGTVWYKKGLYYTAAVILFVLTYVVANHGVEMIDWLTALVQGLF